MHDEFHKRVQRLVNERGMTLRAAETVVLASMHGQGCTEGTVRAQIIEAFEQSVANNQDLLERLIDLLPYYRRVMDHIHTGGSIFYDRGRMLAYCAIAKLASEERKTLCT